MPIDIDASPPVAHDTSMDSPWMKIGATSDPEIVWQSACQAIQLATPSHDLTEARQTLDFLLALFAGKVPGYQPLKTLYHNCTHTMEVFLCASRLLHGMSRHGTILDSTMIDAVLIGALLHDTGYVLEDNEVGGSGAQFTSEHVKRGIGFARRHFNHLPPDLLNMLCVAIETTDHRIDPTAIHYPNPIANLSAKVLATADLVGQMASREYLERLLFLYFEFREAGVGDFADMDDLLEKTLGFYTVTQARLYGHLDGLADRLALHFLNTIGVERNYYMESIARNISYLRQVLSHDRSERLDYLKRGGIVDQVRLTA